MTEPVEVFEGSGNVFADLGLPHPEEHYVRAMLSHLISKAVESRGLTRAQAAELLGTTEAQVSAVVRGRLEGFSLDRLFRFANALGMDVHVSVRPAGDEKTGHLLVSAS